MAITIIRDTVTQLDPDNFGFDIVKVASSTTSLARIRTTGVTSSFANRVIIGVMASMALVDEVKTIGSPVTQKASLDTQDDLKAAADN